MRSIMLITVIFGIFYAYRCHHYGLAYWWRDQGCHRHHYHLHRLGNPWGHHFCQLTYLYRDVSCHFHYCHLHPGCYYFLRHHYLSCFYYRDNSVSGF